jgi:hypothetical protein
MSIKTTFEPTKRMDGQGVAARSNQIINAAIHQMPSRTTPHNNNDMTRQYYSYSAKKSYKRTFIHLINQTIMIIALIIIARP